MAKKMLIDATHAEETRVVVVDGNKVEEFDFESENKRQLAGNIYLAKVTRVEPSLQAAFVDYGGNRHGFLAFSEIHPDYYQIPVADREALLAEEDGAMPRRKLKKMKSPKRQHVRVVAGRVARRLRPRPTMPSSPPRWLRFRTRSNRQPKRRQMPTRWQRLRQPKLSQGSPGMDVR